MERGNTQEIEDEVGSAVRVRESGKAPGVDSETLFLGVSRSSRKGFGTSRTVSGSGI